METIRNINFEEKHRKPHVGANTKIFWAKVFENICSSRAWKTFYAFSIPCTLCLLFPYLLSLSYNAVFFLSIYHTFQGLKENLTKNKKPESDKKFMVIFLDKNCTTKVQFWTLINKISTTKQYLLFTCFTFNWPKLSLTSLT